MKKLITLLTITIFLSSCVDQNQRWNNLKKMYPNSIVEPATGIIKNQGYDFIIIDTNNQIIAVSYYPFSETKISNLRNIR